MKRDLDLVRDILLTLEGHPEPSMPRNAFRGKFLGKERLFQAHLTILQDAGYIEPVPKGPDNWASWRLTWAGHEFLETTRDPEIWEKTKDGAAKVGTFAMPFLVEVAGGYLKAKAAALGLPMM